MPDGGATVSNNILWDNYRNEQKPQDHSTSWGFVNRTRLYISPVPSPVRCPSLLTSVLSWAKGVAAHGQLPICSRAISRTILARGPGSKVGSGIKTSLAEARRGRMSVLRRSSYVFEFPSGVKHAKEH